MANLSIRVDFEGAGRMGPGKIALLEGVARHGSISAAGKAMGMSYRRAWELVSELNATFGRPLVTAKAGGRHGGGSVLTPFGEELVMHYRAIEAKAGEAADAHVRALEASLAADPHAPTAP